MTTFNREDLEVRYRLFETFALDDQRNYYSSTLAKHRAAASQVNRYRAMLAFFTGVCAAAAGFLVQSYFVTGARCTLPGPVPGECGAVQGLVSALIVLAVVLPALGTFFTTLADLYQWDRMITIYDAALENIEVADALSPLPEMDDTVYRASVRAFAEGTLLVMADETAQWGQSVRTPQQLDTFIQQEIERARRVGGDAEGFRSLGSTPTGGRPPAPNDPTGGVGD